MKLLKSIFILSLFSALTTSCTPQGIAEETEKNSTEIQATGEDDTIVDETEKG